MIKRAFKFIGFILLLCLHSASFAASCQMDNSSLRAMGEVQVSLSKQGADSQSLIVNARLADTAQTRSAGFQRVCKEEIANKPILFLFSRPVLPSFHMNNVVAAIDIAFIRENGSIDSIHHMKPYVRGSFHKPKYSSNTPIIAALEVRPGLFEENGLEVGDQISWVFVDNLVE